MDNPEGIEYIVCPLCGMNRILEKKGSRALLKHKPLDGVKGRIRFDQVDLENAKVVQFRGRPSGAVKGSKGGGGGSGFQVKGGLTLSEMIKDGRYQDLVSQIQLQASKIIEKIF